MNGFLYLFFFSIANHSVFCFEITQTYLNILWNESKRLYANNYKFSGARTEA